MGLPWLRLYYSGLGERTEEAMIDSGLTGEAFTGEAFTGEAFTGEA
jgi:hypothetical protein